MKSWFSSPRTHRRQDGGQCDTTCSSAGGGWSFACSLLSHGQPTAAVMEQRLGSLLQYKYKYYTVKILLHWKLCEYFKYQSKSTQSSSQVLMVSEPAAQLDVEPVCGYNMLAAAKLTGCPLQSDTWSSVLLCDIQQWGSLEEWLQANVTICQRAAAKPPASRQRLHSHLQLLHIHLLSDWQQGAVLLAARLDQNSNHSFSRQHRK